MFNVDQRYYASTYGRFNTPDPFRPSANLRNPQSWNRYMYTLGDPANGNDPKGLCDGSDGDLDEQMCEYANGEDDGTDIVLSIPDDGSPQPGDPVFTATGTGCLNDGLTYTGGDNGSCDNPLPAIAAAAFQQVGQNMQGFNGLMGSFAGASLVAGAAAGAAMATAAVDVAPSILGQVPGSSFVGGSASFQVAVDDIAVSRVTPTPVNISGPWTTTETITSGSQATSILSLPSSGGSLVTTTASYLTNGVIPAGSGYFVGIASELFGQPGGGVQIWGAPVIWGATSSLPWLP